MASSTTTASLEDWLNQYLASKGSQLTEANCIEARQLVQRLTDDLGLKTVNSLHGYSVRVLSSLLGANFTDFQVTMLERDLGLSSDHASSHEILACVGRGFDIIRDEKVSLEIIHWGSADKPAEFGFLLPDGVELSKRNQSSTTMEYCSNRKEFIAKLGLNIGGSLVHPDVASVEAKAGFCVDNSRQILTASLLYEWKLFTVEITDFSKLKFSESFVADVSKLPREFHKETEMAYRGFFEKWGCSVITSVDGGGSLEIKTEMNSINKKTNVDSFLTLKASLSNTLAGLTTTANFNVESALSSRSFNLVWSGGDTENAECCPIDFRKITPQSWKLWMTSLGREQVMLMTSMKLKPIYEVIDYVDASKTASCRQALIHIISRKPRGCCAVL